MKTVGIIYLIILSVLAGLIILSIITLSLSLNGRERGIKNHELICHIAQDHNIDRAVLARDC